MAWRVSALKQDGSGWDVDVSLRIYMHWKKSQSLARGEATTCGPLTSAGTAGGTGRRRCVREDHDSIDKDKGTGACRSAASCIADSGNSPSALRCHLQYSQGDLPHSNIHAVITQHPYTRKGASSIYCVTASPVCF